MEWQDKAEIEGGIARLLEETNRLAKAKENVSAEKGALESLLSKHNLPSYKMVLDDREITISIKHSSTNKLDKNRLASELVLESDTKYEPKQLNTKTLIDLAATGKMSTETYNKCFVAEPKQELKVSNKKVKLKKVPKTKK